MHQTERRGSMEHHSAAGIEVLGRESLEFPQSPVQIEQGLQEPGHSPKGFGTPSVGACGCSYTSETCPETFSSITYDVLAQILEVLPSICSGFPTGKSCLHGKVLGRVCCEINEGKWRFNRNDKKKHQMKSSPGLSCLQSVAQTIQPHKKKKNYF